MKAYSEDLREKIVEAVGRGMSRTTAAKTFGVGRSSVKRYAGAARDGEPLAPKRHPGSQPKLDESKPGGYWRPPWNTDRPRASLGSRS
jgi:transposase